MAAGTATSPTPDRFRPPLPLRARVQVQRPFRNLAHPGECESRGAHMQRRLPVVALVATLLLAACGQGETSAEPPGGPPPSTSESQAAPSSATPTPLPDPTAAGPALPDTADAFGAVCAEPVGFSRTTEHSRGRRVHPIMLFYWHEEMGRYLRSLMYLPKSWGIRVDAWGNARPSELARVELIGCQDVVARRRTGEVCRYDDAELALVAETVKVTVYEASSGKELGARDFVDRHPVCPWSTMYAPGDKTLADWPSDAVITDYLRQFVEPRRRR